MRCSILFSLLVAPAAASGQTVLSPVQARDVLREADDAFGRRIGIEDVGLYSESEVRGFDLQSAGNYRIEDHYFVRAAGLLQPVTEGVAIRVGANGLRTDFAAPSGVVQYDLPDGVRGLSATTEAGWWGGSGPVALTRFAAANGDESLSAAGGLQLSPVQRYTDGTRGTFVAFGVVPRWRPARGVRVTAIWSRNVFTRGASTSYSIVGTPPARIRRGIDRTQPWMEARNTSELAGIMVDLEASGGWMIGASAFRSVLPYQRNIFSLIRLSPGAPAQASGLLFGAETRSAVSSEITATRHFGNATLQHRVVAMIRRRDSMALSDPGAPFDLGEYPDLDHPPARALPEVTPDPRRLRDDVSQWTAGLGYRLSIGAAAEIRADIQHVFYSKRAQALDGVVTRQTSQPLLYGGALSVALARTVTAYASFARGLEESGVAPANALNRGEVLPAAISRQAELGLKAAFAGGPTLIAGVFDLAKPLLGVDPRGAFDFVGTVRHRGVELSLAGPLTPRLSIVLGTTYLDARTSGELVDQGIYGVRPINRPAFSALANATWRVPGVDGLSVDGGVSFRSDRFADRSNHISLPAYAVLNVGARLRFQMDTRPFTVRARLANLNDRFAWNASNSGLLNPIAPRTVMLTLTSEW
ncbi:TonB-dependent siderophore receptor [Sphingomonas sp. CJ20]